MRPPWDHKVHFKPALMGRQTFREIALLKMAHELIVQILEASVSLVILWLISVHADAAIRISGDPIDLSHDSFLLMYPMKDLQRFRTG